MDVFFRSMSARGTLGGLSTATTDAVRALDAFGKDKVIVETVGAGQNEVDIVRAADTVAVLVPPGSGDDVQMLKAGILEIADLLVVNKADLDGADRTVRELEEMRHLDDADTTSDGDRETDEWHPRIVETVATRGEGVDELLAAVDDHREHLVASGELDRRARTRHAEEVRRLLREDVRDLLAEEVAARGGLADDVDRILARETDPYSVADEIVAPVTDCVRRHRDGE
jgi:LAO/AO transport system kinase